MYINQYNWDHIVKQNMLPPKAKFLALYFNTFANQRKKRRSVSLKQICEETGLSRPTVLKYMKILDNGEYSYEMV